MSKWTLVDSTPVFENQWLQVIKKSYLHEGQAGEKDYFVVERSPFVIVVALDGSVLLMVRHYRHGTDTKYLELPAGYRDAEESAEDAARRELLEETSYAAGKATLLWRTAPATGLRSFFGLRRPLR